MKKIKNIIIPMAGFGKRFKSAQFNTIKPLIFVDNETILEKAIKNLPQSEKRFLILNEKIFKKKILRKVGEKYKFEYFLLKNKTLGQADTVNKVKNLIKSNHDCLIHSCDYIMKYNFDNFSEVSKKSDVIVFVSKLKSKIIKNYNSFAYCKIDNKNIIKKIVEKKTISKNPKNDHAVVGSFWFRKSSDCFLSHEIALSKNDKINEEYYIGNNINHLIKLGRQVRYLEVDVWINLGDIFSYLEYIYWQNFFEKIDN